MSDGNIKLSENSTISESDPNEIKDKLNKKKLQPLLKKLKPKFLAIEKNYHLHPYRWEVVSGI